MSTSADILITNASVLTMDRARPRAEAVALQGDRIVFVGSAEDANTALHARLNAAVAASTIYPSECRIILEVAPS